MKNKKTIRLICEGAILTALALVLSYIKLDIAALGGSIDLVMIPLVIFAVRWGAGWGLGIGLVFGTLKYFFAAGFAVNWQSMLLDYSVAYMAVGLAGFFKSRDRGMLLGAVAGGLARYLVHFISGVTIYAEYMPEEFWGMPMTNTWIYSLLYNGSYMVPNIVIAAIACAALSVPLRKLAPLPAKKT